MQKDVAGIPAAAGGAPPRDVGESKSPSSPCPPVSVVVSPPKQIVILMLLGEWEWTTVAIFHASFHPTKGNIIDWALKADDGASSSYSSLISFRRA